MYSGARESGAFGNVNKYEGSDVLGIGTDQRDLSGISTMVAKEMMKIIFPDWPILIQLQVCRIDW
jgi:hypothetical protein